MKLQISPSDIITKMKFMGNEGFLSKLFSKKTIIKEGHEIVKVKYVIYPKKSVNENFVLKKLNKMNPFESILPSIFIT
jgi:hypothetical protein